VRELVLPNEAELVGEGGQDLAELEDARVPFEIGADWRNCMAIVYRWLTCTSCPLDSVRRSVQTLVAGARCAPSEGLSCPAVFGGSAASVRWFRVRRQQGAGAR
jgi:hypothetical protein